MDLDAIGNLLLGGTVKPHIPSLRFLGFLFLRSHILQPIAPAHWEIMADRTKRFSSS